jgi:hypothetical protein
MQVQVQLFLIILSKISGSTNFYNITVASGASLTPQVSSSIGIAGTFTNNGILDAMTFSNLIITVQIKMINPNGTIAGYYNLSISGSGIKTMPSTSMSVLIFLFLERQVRQ